MAKTLIYINKNKLRNCGGPVGYCNNLFIELNKRENEDVKFIDAKVNKTKWYASLKKNKLALFCKRLSSNYKLIYGKKHFTSINLNEYDIIHFHSTRDMYQVRDSLKNYQGKILLTSHSPTIASKEALVNRNKFEIKMFSWLFNKLIRMDEYAFERADYILFPCEDAEEPYHLEWEGFKKVKKTKPFKYILTGINGCSAKISEKEIREKYNIPQDAFVICYVGRHNSIKGYDKLLEIGEKVLEKYDNVYFLIAGKEGPMYGLKKPRWIEVGWTNDPHSFIAASDLFILPNKHTYFDLVLLEVLSLGKSVLMTYTGGNKYVHKLNKGGLFVYNDVHEALSSIDKLYELGREKLNEVGLSNKEIFNENFTVEKFTDRYLEILDEVINEK